MENITKTIKKIIKDNGIEIIFQEQRLKAMLADLHPKEKRFRYLLELSIKAGLPNKLIAFQNESSSIGEAQISGMKHYFKEEYYLDEQAVNSVFDCWIKILRSEENSITDIDGNVCHFVNIGNQVWMVENLKTTRFNDGSAIPLVTENSEWENLSSPGYCWYDNDEHTYKNKFGALYNWYTVITGKLCPKGWHVPSEEEWTTLINFLGGDDIAGGKLKEAGYNHWDSPNTGATNETGFTAHPGGDRSRIYFDGIFDGVGDNGYWWSSTAGDAAVAWGSVLGYSSAGVGRVDKNKQDGLSVRCLRDY